MTRRRSFTLPAAVADPLRDQLQSALGASYTLERELGGGGMSRVFVADDAALGRRVVVKVLAPELAEELSAERFTREIRLSARLQHPNVVPVLAAGTGPDGLPFYTVTFIDGASLRERLVEGPVPLSDAIAALRDVARALAYAHAHGVVHRDVMPENVWLTGGAAVVVDFGIADRQLTLAFVQIRAYALHGSWPPGVRPPADGERVESGGAMCGSTVPRRTSHRFIPTIPLILTVGFHFLVSRRLTPRR
ncbi:MAG: serine/threonine-protein kinase [Gemmatimonadaceae bacterium]